MTASRSSEAGAGSGRGGPTAHGSRSRSPSPDGARHSLAGGPGRRLPVAQADQRQRKLVDAIGADQTGDLDVGAARPQARVESARIRQCEGLGKHRPGIPVDVTKTTLRVFPAGPPRDTGDDQRRRVASGRGPHLHESVADRVVPMDAIRKPGNLSGRDVDLEREAAARGPGRAEQPATIGALHDPNDTGGQVEQPGKSGQLEVGRRCNVLAGEDRGRRSRDRRPVARQLDDRQPGRIRLARRRQARHVQRDEVRQHARVADRDGTAGLRPLKPRPVP
jgi:hypothetical protein